MLPLTNAPKQLLLRGVGERFSQAAPVFRCVKRDEDLGQFFGTSAMALSG